jgi:virginiamycin B lyase
MKALVDEISNRARFLKAFLLLAVLLLAAPFLMSEQGAISHSKANQVPPLKHGVETNLMRAGPGPFSKSVKLQLPDGPGKRIFLGACTTCHAGQQIARVNYGPKDWTVTVRTMHAWGANLDEDEIPALVAYLSRNFNEAKRAPGVTIPGPVHATLKNYEMPIPDSLPHDTWFSDGYLWISQVAGQALARFDPKTQKFKEFTMRRTADPKTLVADKDGNIWFATDLSGFIGKFDPKTQEVTEYTPPGPKLEFHDITIDQKGIVWFCVLDARPPLYPVGSKIGRLDPKTGDFKLLDTPTRDASPYAIQINSKGVPYYTSNQRNILGSIDPDTLKITEHFAPDAATRMKRVTITSDDMVWYADRNRGYLARYDPKTDSFKEWPSPSGRRSYPYGIGHVGDVIWYVEAEANPNMLVRFDPKTGKFQTWPIKDGGGMKHVHPGPDGSLWLTRPLNNGITHVTIK